MILVGAYENADYSDIKLGNGNNITLTQDAYVSTDDTYEAHAIDADGNDYLVKWDVVRHDVEHDESCDWDNFRVYAV